MKVVLSLMSRPLDAARSWTMLFVVFGEEVIPLTGSCCRVFQFSRFGRRFCARGGGSMEYCWVCEGPNSHQGTGHQVAQVFGPGEFRGIHLHCRGDVEFVASILPLTT